LTAAQRCHQQQDDRDRDVHARIVGVHLEQRLLHQSRHNQRAADAEDRKPAAVRENHSHYRRASCA
jgi:hypothetical protein